MVVIGYGLAGTVAAITAHDEGAHVLVVEKQPADTLYTSSSLSGGLFVVSSDVENTVRYMEELNHVHGDVYWTDKEITRVWADYIAQNKDWFEKLGGKVKLWKRGAGERPDLPGAESLDQYRYQGMGVAMMKFVYGQISSRNIEVMYGTPAKRLLLNSRSRIAGVTVESTQGNRHRKMNIKANKAVILACGGFEFNEQMKLNYLKAYPSYFYSTPANTGDGIKMAMEVGADLWHMNCAIGRMMAKFPESPLCFLMEFGGKGWMGQLVNGEIERAAAGYIVVDRYGRRYTNENFNFRVHSQYYEMGMFDNRTGEHPRIPSYWIFDKKRIEAGPLAVLSAGLASLRFYEWSKDNSAELKKGWIKTAMTPRELAGKLGIPADALDNTVKNYNACCSQGKDPEFGRGASDLIPLANPPFYAVELWPGGPNTLGGPRRNRNAQIVNTDGEPIPGLYGAGELGAVYGMIYPASGGMLAECIAFGRIAGKHAAMEKAR